VGCRRTSPAAGAASWELAPLTLFLTTLLVVRNQRILHAWTARQETTSAAQPAGLPPKTRKRRRKTLAGLAGRTALTAAAATTSPAPATTAAMSMRKRALTQNKPGNQAPPRHPGDPGTGQDHRPVPECQTQT